MKILSYGKYSTKKIVFVCDCCMCTFEADPGEYVMHKEPIGLISEAKCPGCGSNVEEIII